MPYGQPKRIVLIEDETTLRESLVRYFTDNGYTVYPAATIQEGIFRIQEANPPHLVITDWNLGIDTGEAIIRWADSHGCESIPFIVHSGEFRAYLDPILGVLRLIHPLITFVPKRDGVRALEREVQKILEESSSG